MLHTSNVRHLNYRYVSTLYMIYSEKFEFLSEYSLAENVVFTIYISRSFLSSERPRKRSRLETEPVDEILIREQTMEEMGLLLRFIYTGKVYSDRYGRLLYLSRYG